VTPATQHAFFLASGSNHLAATCLLPETVRGAVLLVPPFAEERKGALPALVKVARSLAERGVASLLVDFAGCGDSSGAFDAVPTETFESDADAALAWLALRFPDVPRAVLGVRTGATLATRLTARHPDLSALALWSPVSGPDFLRQLLQRRMVNDMVAYGKAQESRASLESRLHDGETVDLDGYPFSAAFYAWLHGLTPLPADVPTFLATGGHDGKAAASLADATRSALRFPPFWNTVGHVDLSALVNETVTWLAARFGATAPLRAPQLNLCATASFGEQVDLTREPTVRAFIETPPGTPRGGVLFLHGWSGDRTGPHRLFVRAARLFASSGWLCLRPDFIGRGLSDGADSDASIARMADNAQTALDALRGRLPAGAPVAVVAICSGCKVAVALASKEQDIERLLLWSAESMGSLRSSATGLRKTLSALATYARKLTRPETWKKLLSGKVQTGMVTQALVKHETRSAEEAVWEDGVLKAFRVYRHPALFVFGGSDPDAPGSSRAYEAYCRRHGVPHTLHTIPHAGHSYYNEVWTRELLDISARFLSD
jgi:pimeloyl-ACP methyl ester carboxylesterase